MDQQKTQQPKPKPREEGCNVRFKRDKSGRVTGFSATGHCTREHLKLANGSIDDASTDDD
ncbi:MAG: hypothetical protein PHF86_12490 [Candidatus Nanoarchaeia archaeon]|nr:hypothetical protein [Candidatus Nanoarchaeia archaeon]